MKLLKYALPGEWEDAIARKEINWKEECNVIFEKNVLVGKYFSFISKKNSKLTVDIFCVTAFFYSKAALTFFLSKTTCLTFVPWNFWNLSAISGMHFFANIFDARVTTAFTTNSSQTLLFLSENVFQMIYKALTHFKRRPKTTKMRCSLFLLPFSCNKKKITFRIFFLWILRVE